MPTPPPVGIEIDIRSKPERAQVRESEPFRIAIFGDFGGDRKAGSLGPIQIDRDNFDDVLAKIAPVVEVKLHADVPAIAVPFQSLDDFHPDSLFRRLPYFSELGELRGRLADPAAFRSAAASRESLAPEAPADPGPVTGRELLAQMLEEGKDPPAVPRRASRYGDLQTFIDQALAGSLVPRRDPKQEGLLARTDAAIAEEMRALLHHPDFQALEAAWRGLFFLVRRLETGVDLQIHLFDWSREQLREDLNNAADLQATRLYRQVVTSAADKMWALLVGNYSFSAGAQDIELLARVGMIACAAGAPFLAGAAPSVLGCDSLTGVPEPRDWRPKPSAMQFWELLRELPEAASIGLLMPRFLLRLPYGADTNPAETFALEEAPGVPAHEDYLWGNPALLGALLLGQAFSEDGWGMRPETHREVTGMPLHIYQQDGEPVAQPCAEAWLSDRAAEAILERGIMPLVSTRDSDRVLAFRYQSVADPPKPLRGPWGNAG